MTNLQNETLGYIRDELASYHLLGPRMQSLYQDSYFELINELARRGVYSPEPLPFDDVPAGNPAQELNQIRLTLIETFIDRGDSLNALRLILDLLKAHDASADNPASQASDDKTDHAV